MLVCKCDRCGREMGGNVLSVPATIAGVRFDFCDACHKAVVDYIKKDVHYWDNSPEVTFTPPR